MCPPSALEEFVRVCRTAVMYSAVLEWVSKWPIIQQPGPVGLGFQPWRCCHLGGLVGTMLFNAPNNNCVICCIFIVSCSTIIPHSPALGQEGALGPVACCAFHPPSCSGCRAMAAALCWLWAFERHLSQACALHAKCTLTCPECTHNPQVAVAVRHNGLSS